MVASARSVEIVTAAAYAKGGCLDKELLIRLSEYRFVQHVELERILGGRRE